MTRNVKFFVGTFMAFALILGMAAAQDIRTATVTEIKGNVSAKIEGHD